MPDMDGYEVARELHNQMTAHRIHIIAVTGYGRKQDVRHAYESGFDCHLLKPVDPTALQAVLRRFGMPRPGDDVVVWSETNVPI
jgi:CheY-like chemotaxis protein